MNLKHKVLSPSLTPLVSPSFLPRSFNIFFSCLEIRGQNRGFLKTPQHLLIRGRQRHLNAPNMLRHAVTRGRLSPGLLMDNTVSGVHHHTHRYPALTFAARSQQSALLWPVKTTSVTDHHWALACAAPEKNPKSRVL